MTLIPQKYIPKYLSKKDKKKLKIELKKSRKLYKQGKYYSRKKVKGFKSKKSLHINNAEKIYNLKSFKLNNNLAKKTKCSLSSLKKIFKKGQGAYFSSGSRPNQTSHSWGYARVASAITGGKSAIVDFKILEEGCKSGSKALKLATKKKKLGMNNPIKIKIGGGRGRGRGRGRGTEKEKENLKMREKIIKFYKSEVKGKKYGVIIKDLKTNKTRRLNFGGLGYEQFKDRTPLKLYKKFNHSDKNRQKNYYSRHSKGIGKRSEAINFERRKSNGYYTPKLLSHIFLW